MFRPSSGPPTCDPLPTGDALEEQMLVFKGTESITYHSHAHLMKGVLAASPFCKRENRGSDRMVLENPSHQQG